MNRTLSTVMGILLVLLLAQTAMADMITFENTDGNIYTNSADGGIASVTTASNVVTISTVGGATGNAYMAEVGGTKGTFGSGGMEAFQGGASAVDTPGSGNFGQYFLTDEYYGADSSSSSHSFVAADYLFDFENPIDSLTFDIYDYGDDRPRWQGTGTVTLTLFDDLGGILGADTYTILWPDSHNFSSVEYYRNGVFYSTGFSDGNALNLSTSVEGQAYSASLVFTGAKDSGMGIDNLEFNTATEPNPTPDPDPVPEPATVLLIGAGLLVLGVIRKKFIH